MPNSFGTRTKTWPIKDSASVEDLRRRYSLARVPNLDRANGIWISGGKWPARGWILLQLSDYIELKETVGLFGTDYYLRLEDVYTGRKVAIRNLCIVQAKCVTAGQIDDTNALYLVELTDRRGLLWNQWFRQPTASYFNVPAPAYPGQYYDGSLNHFVPWTWDFMMESLWEQQQTALGEYPGLPFAPQSIPENFLFPGVSAWEAMNRVLDLLGCTVAVNLIDSEAFAPYLISSYGQIDTDIEPLMAASEQYLEDDWQNIDVGAGRVPGNVVVHFHRRNKYYGTEETIRKDSWQWEMRGFYTVSVPAPALYRGGVGTHYLWDDFQVVYNEDGNPLAADVVTAGAIARERTAQYYANITRNGDGYMHRVYSGLIPFATGPTIDGVCFRQDYRENRRGGWRTEIVRGDPPWEWMKG